MPIQLHIFADAAESANQCTGPDHEAQARCLAEQLAKARAWAGHPTRDARGTVLWRKSLPFAGPALTDEIERSARRFFTSVYSLRNVKRRTLRHAFEASAPCPAKGAARSRGSLPRHLVPTATLACNLLCGDSAYGYVSSGLAADGAG